MLVAAHQGIEGPGLALLGALYQTEIADVGVHVTCPCDGSDGPQETPCARSDRVGREKFS